MIAGQLLASGLAGKMRRNMYSVSSRPAASRRAVCCLLTSLLCCLGRAAEAGRPQVMYSPGDTQLLDYTAFCEDLSVGYSANPVNLGPSAVYALNSKPVLMEHDSYSFYRTDVLDNSNRYYDWNLHFYEDSTIDASACVNGDGSAEYYIIQGKKGFDDWVNSRSMSAVVASSTFNSNCTEMNYRINEEDQYFVVWTISDEKAINISISLTFNRAKYRVENEYYARHYFDASGSTSVQTPLNQNSFIVLVYGNSSETPDNWDTLALDAEVKCTPRVWLYAVTIIGPIVVLLLLIVCTVCCIWCVRCSKRCSPEDSPLLRNWEDDTYNNSYYRYSDSSKRLDPLTELAIATPKVSNPHLAPFKEDLRSPSFQDDYLAVGSPKFSTFKPVN